MDVPGISRPVLVVLIVAAVLLFAFGATKAVGRLTEHTDTQTRTLAAAPTIVVVSTQDRRRRIVAADRSDVRLTTQGEALGLGRRPRRAARRRRRTAPAGPLPTSCPVVDDAVPRELRPRGAAHAPACGWSPAPATCAPRTSRAVPTLRSGTGDLHVVGVRGPLRLTPTPATCTSRAPAPDVVARHEHRRHRRRGQPSRASVAAQADTGDINIIVPDADLRGRRRSRTPATSTSTCDRDDASPRTLDAHTDTGDVHLSSPTLVS